MSQPELNTAILFRVDASAQMGMGHLMRCLALAQAMRLAFPQLAIYFALSTGSVPYAQSREDWLGELILVPEQLALADEPLWLAQVCAQNTIGMFILDGYQFDQDYCQQLHPLPCMKVVFDDNNNSGLLFADAVINGASNAAHLDYQVSAPGALLCVGEQYRILREEFAADSARLPWAERHSLSIVMGGSDPLNLSLSIMQALQQSGFADNIILVTGAAYQHLSSLQQFLQHSQLRVSHRHNCQHMADVFSQSRLVVSAAGGSQFELAACYCPALLLVVADNQRNATAQAITQGWCQSLDMLQGANATSIVEKLTQLWASQEALEHMHEAAKQHGDWQGAERVVRQLALRYKEQFGE